MPLPPTPANHRPPSPPAQAGAPAAVCRHVGRSETLMAAHLQVAVREGPKLGGRARHRLGHIRAGPRHPHPQPIGPCSGVDCSPHLPTPAAPPAGPPARRGLAVCRHLQHQTPLLGQGLV
eukprot:scaffold12267_cov120-Isochrysis_galbana.AAC.6